MKVALTAWEDKISPVFDSARTLLIAEIENKEIISSRYELFNPEMTHCLADSLDNLGVDVLICGAISETPAKIIEACGINFIPFIGGNLEEVLLSYAKENRIKSIFLMPGCGGKRNRTKKCNTFLNNKRR
ncbi:MAG TPA: dinitrogenase iron-molybdenum cofactor biosynthesis domain-containing protein [Desulfobacteraceae bacterium]|nr:dinitrogenase iron-molybdenum cofactor biosynthesis domain-containing protein [Desulfobacteraceae bacterium]